jgi:hypothetical protein
LYASNIQIFIVDFRSYIGLAFFRFEPSSRGLIFFMLAGPLRVAFLGRRP